MNSVSVFERTLTRLDHTRLNRLLQHAGQGSAGELQPMLDLLECSDVVDSPEVPSTVVTMNTQVLLQEPGEDARKVTLCYPGDAAPAAGLVSVLSPIGSSLLGLRHGDVAVWSGPDGRERQARIVQVLFQPEASGDYLT